MNATDAKTIADRWVATGRAASRTRVEYLEARNRPVMDWDVKAVATWYCLDVATVRRALFIRWMLNTGRLASSLAEGN